MNQAELLGSVRKGIEAAQAVATTRLETLEGDARKVLSGLVEKGRDSQRNLTQRIQRIAESEAIRNSVRPVENVFRRVPVSELRDLVEKRVDELSRRFEGLRTNTRGLLVTASREQLEVLVRELRRIADRLASFTAEGALQNGGTDTATNGSAESDQPQEAAAADAVDATSLNGSATQDQGADAASEDDASNEDKTSAAS